MQLRSRTAILLASIIIGFIALAAASAFTKQPFNDESVFGTASYNLAFHGSLSNAVLEGGGTFREGMVRHFYWQPPLFLVVNAAAIRIFGFNLITVRAVAILAGAAALMGVFFLTLKLANQRTALLATLLAGGDYFILICSSEGRMDSLCLALGMTALASYCLLRERSLPLAVLVSHAAVAANGATHPNAVIWLGNLVVLTLLLDRGRIRPALMAWAAVPYLVAALSWGAFIARDPADFKTQFLGNIRESGAANWSHKHPLEAPLEALGLEIRERYLAPYGLGPGVGLVNRIKGVVLLVYLAAVGAGIFLARNSLPIRLILLLALLTFCAMTFVAGNKIYYYLPHITSLFAILTALVLAGWLERGGFHRWAVYGVVGVLLLVQTAGVAYRIRQNSYAKQYRPMVDAVLQNSQPGDLVLGPSAMIWDLMSRRTLSDDYQLGFRTGLNPKVIVVSVDYKYYQSEAPPAVREHAAQKLQSYTRLLSIGDYEVYGVRH